MLGKKANEIEMRYGKDAGFYFLGLAHDFLDAVDAEREVRKFYERR